MKIGIERLNLKTTPVTAREAFTEVASSMQLLMEQMEGYKLQEELAAELKQGNELVEVLESNSALYFTIETHGVSNAVLAFANSVGDMAVLLKTDVVPEITPENQEQVKTAALEALQDTFVEYLQRFLKWLSEQWDRFLKWIGFRKDQIDKQEKLLKDAKAKIEHIKHEEPKHEEPKKEEPPKEPVKEQEPEKKEEPKHVEPASVKTEEPKTPLKVKAIPHENLQFGREKFHAMVQMLHGIKLDHPREGFEQVFDIFKAKIKEYQEMTAFSGEPETLEKLGYTDIEKTIEEAMHDLEQVRDISVNLKHVQQLLNKTEADVKKAIENAKSKREKGDEKKVLDQLQSDQAFFKMIYEMYNAALGEWYRISMMVVDLSGAYIASR